jgi:hypothetical protein
VGMDGTFGLSVSEEEKHKQFVGGGGWRRDGNGMPSGPCGIYGWWPWVLGLGWVPSAAFTFSRTTPGRILAVRSAAADDGARRQLRLRFPLMT